MVFLESMQLPLSLMTDLETYSWKKTPSGKCQGHILARKGPDLQPAGDWRLAGVFLGKCHCVLVLSFAFDIYYQPFSEAGYMVTWCRQPSLMLNMPRCEERRTGWS